MVRFGIMLLSWLVFLSSDAARAAELERGVVAGWDVSAHSKDGSGEFSHCTTSVRYGRDTFLLFAINRTFNWTMSLVHSSWNLRVGEEMRIIYSLDDGPKLTTTAVAVGKDQFVVRMTDSVALFQSFRRGRVLQFETQSGAIIPFNLTNSSRALDAALECAKRWMAQQGPRSPHARIYVPPATLRATAQAFLQEAGISDYKFLPLEQGDPELAWEYSDRTRATLLILRPEAKISMERALAQTIERDTAFCKGQYSSGYMAAKYHLGSEIRRLYTACSDPVKSFTFIYSVIQLPSGAIVRFGSSAKMSSSGTPETDTLPRTESIEAAGLRTVGARH